MVCLCVCLEVLVGFGRVGWDDFYYGWIIDFGLFVIEFVMVVLIK